MAYTQNSSIDNAKLILGNCKIETAASAGGSYTNLGNGAVLNFNHNITPYDVQGRNGPDPVEGIADETVTIDFELIEWNGTALSELMCGAISDSSTTTISTITAGGNTQLTPRAFRITNKTFTKAGNSAETVMTVYYATPSTGIVVNFKNDQDADPVAVMPFQIVGKNDVSKTAGNQLYTITRDITT